MRGFFGGTFDPIHLGHINLAVQLKERAGLDEIWFCPAFCNPFKEGKKGATPEERLEMIALAIAGFPGFKVIDEEIKRASPSYTIDTLRALVAKGHGPFRLLLGEDQIDQFSNWKESEALKKLAPPLFGRRGSSGTHADAIDIPLFDVSATEVRERVKKGKWIGHLVPTQVNDYILKKGLYLDV